MLLVDVIPSKVMPCPLHSYLMLFSWFLSGPIVDVASTIFWRDNQKIAGRWEGNTVWYQIPLDIQAFISRVSYSMFNNSISQGSL